MKKAFLYTAAATVLICAALVKADETRLHECVKNSDASDTACDSCYYLIYKAYPN